MNARLLESSLFVAATLMANLSGSAQDIGAGRKASAQDIKATLIGATFSAKRTQSPLTVTTNGPADPTNPARPLFCNKDVQKEFGRAFMKTRNGEARMGLAEAGRSIELSEGAIVFGPWAATDLDDGENEERANRMNIARDGSTIAFFHTHGNNARPVPSARDLGGDVPDFVISRFAIYVTIPGTNTYLQLDPTVCK